MNDTMNNTANDAVNDAASDTPQQSIDTATGELAPAAVSSERVKRIFAHIASRYELFNALSSFGTYKAWLAKMVRMTDVRPDSAVLDVAGGTGDVTFSLARAKKPAVIVCSDLVPEMLDVARAHAADGRAGDVPVYFDVVDAQDIPYANDTFDVVTMAYGLRNMPRRELALKEMLRVLKPGGQLVCLDFSTPESPLLHKAYDIYLNNMIPLWGKVVTGDESGFVYLSKSIKAFPNQAGVAKLMEDAGFCQVEWSDCMGGIACVHTARKPA